MASVNKSVDVISRCYIWRMMAFAVLWVVAISGALSALEVKDVRWGYNGSIQYNAFNLLTVDLDNPGPTAFDGVIELRPESGIGRGGTIPYTEFNVYIGPGETRTVQFTPVVTSAALEWELKWTGTQQTGQWRFPHSQKQITSPVVVQFQSSRGLSNPIKGVPTFEESDFPIGAAGSEGLGTVVLDHVPAWDEVRNRAFRDWLGRGGRLFLLPDRNGQRLDFPGVLNELNVSADYFRVGQGVVIRHAMVRDASEIPGLMTEIATSTDNSTNIAGLQTDPTADGASQLFATMRSMVRPNHNWTLIFFLAIVYLLILFPGIWLVSQRRGDFRVTYALILGTVLVFSWLYAVVGKRGYNESTGLRQMILAYPLGNERIAMQKYSSLFVTDGGTYAIPTSGEGAALALDWSTEFSGDGAILNRPQGGIAVDIPPYSACSYQENSALRTSSDYSWKIQRLEVTAQKIAIEVDLGTAFPANAQTYFVTQGRAVSLSRHGNKWSSAHPPQELSSMFPVEYGYTWSRLGPDVFQKNLMAYLAQTATATQVAHVYGNGAYFESAPQNSKGVNMPFRSGHLLIYGDASQEFLPSEYSASGKTMFVIRVDASMVTEAAPAQ